jgi:membrane protease YdiL (CAAX protease family)
MNRNTLLLVTLISEGGLYFIGLALMSSAEIELRSVFSVSWFAIGLALLLSFPMLAALFLLERISWEPIVNLKNEIDEKVRPIFSQCNLVDFGLIAFFAGVGEELFFRGWMQAVMIERSGLVIGIIVASLVFGFLHYLSTAYAVFAFITSIYLGAIYLISENLFIVMAIHAIYDFIALVYLVKKGEKGAGDSSPAADETSGES